MNTLHISRQFYPFIGGVENYIYEITKRLVKDGINCRILTLNYNIFDKKQKFLRYEKINEIEVFRIRGFGYYKKPIPLNLSLKLFAWADIVHIHDLRFLYETSLFLKPFLRYKLVWSTHGFLLHTKDFKILKSFIIPAYYNPTIKNFVDAVICDSSQDLEYFKNWQSKNLYFIENGIDFEKFSKIEKVPLKNRFLYFGRIDKNKGLDLLFKTLSQLEDCNWQLDIVGSGFNAIINNLKILSKDLGISEEIYWQGFVAEDKLFEFLANSYLCFFPSTYEGFGFTLIEAMASGCICIANSIDTYKCVIKDGENGFICDFSNPKQSVTKIKNILSLSEDKFISIGKRAKKDAKRYRWEEKINQIITVYQKVYNS